LLELPCEVARGALPLVGDDDEMRCQATGETDPFPTLKLTPPDLVFVRQSA
jgi:hypothetical protein